MPYRVVSVFQHRCKESTHLQWSRRRSVRILRLTAWSRWREIVSVCKSEKQTPDDMHNVICVYAWSVKRMLVGAPWDGPPNNRKGDVYKCMVGEEKNSNCIKVNLGETKKTSTLKSRCVTLVLSWPVCLSQGRLLSRMFLKTWGILTWEWPWHQTHLMAFW